MAFDTNNNFLRKYLSENLSGKSLDYIYSGLCSERIRLDDIKDLNYVDDRGCSLILLASINGNLKLVRKLVDSSRVVYTQCNNANSDPLHMAIKFEHYDLVEYLIEEKGVLADNVDSHGATPLKYAIEKGNGDLFNYLIARGADFDLVGDNPLKLAVNSLNINFINLILFFLKRKHISKTYCPFVDLAYSYCHPFDFKNKLTMFKYLLRHPQIKIRQTSETNQNLNTLVKFNKFRFLKVLILNNYDVDQLQLDELNNKNLEDATYCKRLLAVLKLTYYLGFRFQNVITKKLSNESEPINQFQQSTNYGNQHNFFFGDSREDWAADQQTVSLQQTQVYQAFLSWLSRRPKLQSLQQLSRIALRKHFNKNLIHLMSNVNYPPSLIRFLCLDDLRHHLDVLDT